MPSQLHETLAELFRHRPALAAEIAECLGVKLPAWQQARPDSGELPELTPAEWHADAVVTLTDSENEPVLAVIVEVQLRRDDGKRLSWPAYLANLRARLDCPVLLLVVCRHARTAAWCGRPIELGPGSVVTPYVLGPKQVPLVTDVGQAARSPGLAVLSAMAHTGPHQRERVFHALLAALDSIDPQRATLYAGVVWKALPASARPDLEAMMTASTAEYRDYLSPFVNRFVNQGRREGEAIGKAEGEAIGKAEGKVEGKAEGESKAVLAVLAARNVDVPADARARIIECTDLDQLETWVTRAATARSVDDLFD